MNDEPQMPVRRIARSSFIIHHSSFILICLVFALMLGWTWFGWPDPIIDFGRELYVPWQITQGKVLYRDIAYFNGPLSPYFNALVFSILGVSLRSLVIANLVLLALLTWMVWRLWAFMAGRFAATVACVLLLTCFAFLRLTVIGNYNFVAPYSHELTHGIVLGFAGLSCIMEYLRRRRPAWLAAAGGALGLIFLTKIEVIIAGTVAIPAGVLLALRSHHVSQRELLTAVAAFAAPALLVPVAAALLLWMALPPGQALHAITGSVTYALDPRVREMQFYEQVMGTLDAGQSIATMLIQFGCYAVLALIAAGASWALRGGRQRWHAPAAVFALAAIALGAIYLFADVAWEQAFRGLELAIGLVVIIAFANVIREWRALSPQRIMQATVSLFALALTLKMALNLRTQHYGFALAMPAILVVAASALSWLPRWLGRRGANGAVFRAAALAAAGLFVFMHLEVYGRLFSDQPATVGRGADAFRADQRGAAVDMIVRHIERSTEPDATLMVIPEGVMINYLARRENPTGYINLPPLEITMFGEDWILQTMRQRAPDYVLLVRLDRGEHGFRTFADYAPQLYAWVREQYEPVPTPQERALPMLLMRCSRTPSTSRGQAR